MEYNWQLKSNEIISFCKVAFNDSRTINNAAAWVSRNKSLKFDKMATWSNSAIELGVNTSTIYYRCHAAEIRRDQDLDFKKKTDYILNKITQ